MKSAAVIIIGNEILSGKFQDRNGPYFIKRLRELGVALQRLVVVPDDLEVISEELRLCTRRHDLVFTTGGIGPTHDDITLQAVAHAFGVPLVERPELVQLLKDRGKPINEASRRMTRVPQGSELIWPEALRFPLVMINGVHIFPGVPSFMQMKFEAVAERWRGPTVFTARVVTDEREEQIAARLEQAVVRWPGVDVGSYPRFEDGPWHVIVTLEGTAEAEVEASRAWLAGELAPFTPATHPGPEAP